MFSNLKFSAKTWSTIQISLKWSSLLTNHGCMAMRLKPKANHPNGSVQPRTKKAHHHSVKCESFAHFISISSIAMTLCIMNSCHKIVRLIIKTSLEVLTCCPRFRYPGETSLESNWLREELLNCWILWSK